MLSPCVGKTYFVKVNKRSYQEMFVGEYDALTEIEQSLSIWVPKPLFYGVFAEFSYLASEYLPLDHSTHGSGLASELAQIKETTQKNG